MLHTMLFMLLAIGGGALRFMLLLFSTVVQTYLACKFLSLDQVLPISHLTVQYYDW